MHHTYTHEFQNIADAHFTMDFNYFSVMVCQNVSVYTERDFDGALYLVLLLRNPFVYDEYLDAFMND